MKFKCPGTVGGPCPDKATIVRTKGSQNRLRCPKCASGQKAEVQRKANQSKRGRPIRRTQRMVVLEEIAAARAVKGKSQGTKAASEAVQILINWAS